MPGTSEPADPLKILIADANTLFREGIREILDAESDLIVAGLAADGCTAVDMSFRFQPDVVVLDVAISPRDPVKLLLQLRDACPETRIIVLSAQGDSPVLWEVLGNGASAFLQKNATRGEFLSAIRSVVADATRVVISISRGSLPGPSASPRWVLSERELDVLGLVASAMSNAQIATRLGIAEGTVKRHLRNIFTKLGAVSRIDAINKAAAASLISVPLQGAPVTAEPGGGAADRLPIQETGRPGRRSAAAIGQYLAH